MRHSSAGVENALFGVFLKIKYLFDKIRHEKMTVFMWQTEIINQSSLLMFLYKDLCAWELFNKHWC